MTDQLTGLPRRGRPRNEAADAAILEATLVELVETGIAGLAMESIAVRAGVAKTTVYRRHANSTDLVAAALRTLNGPVQEPPAGSCTEQLRATLHGVHALWCNPRFASIMRRLAADSNLMPEAFREMQQRVIGPHVALLHRLIDRAGEEGLIRSDIEADQVRVMLVAPIVVNGLTSSSLVTVDLVDTVLDTVLRGLAP